MAECIPVSRSSLLLRSSYPASTKLPPPSLCFGRSANVSRFTSLSLLIGCSTQQKRLSKWTNRVGPTAPTLVIESAGEKEDKIEVDNGGVDGFGGQGSGNGGGGGDNNDNSGGNTGGSDKSDDYGSSESKKTGMSMSQKLTLGYAALVGVGGVMGYMKSGSQKSLVAGGVSALLLYCVYMELPVRPVFASSLGLGLSAALLGVMGSRFKKSGKIFPAGVVSLVSLVMTGGYLHGILRSLH